MFNIGSLQGYLKLNTTGWITPMKTANASVNTLTRSFTRMGVVAVASLGLITREFGKFDKAIRHATSVSDTTMQQFEQMSDMALDASVKWNKAAADTAQAFYYLGSAGLTVTEQLQAFNATIMLSRAMGSELSQTVEGAVDIVKAFGLEFANLDKIADQLTKTIISSNQNFRTLDQALTYASSTARLTNNTLAETAAMLGVMANAGIKGSMAGTVLRRAMTNLMAPTGGMASLVYKLGLEIYDTTGAMKPFITIMGEISDQLKGTSEEYKNMVFETLFGRRAIAGQIVLFNQGSDALRKYAKEIENASGTTARVAGKQMAAFTEILGQMWQEVRRVAIQVGGALAPALERLANAMRFKLEVFREYLEANKAAVAQAVKWTAALGAILAIGLPLMTVVMAIAMQFVFLAKAIAAASLAAVLNPFTALLALLYVLKATISTDFWKKAWDNNIKPFLGGLATGFFQTLTQIMWQFSLIPGIIETAFSKESMLNSLSYFTKALQQIGIVGRIAMAPFSGENIIGLAMDYKVLNDEMHDLLFGTQTDQSSFTQALFGSKAERDASYQAYITDLKIVGKEIVVIGKDISSNFSAAIKASITDDINMLKNALGNMPDSLKEALDTLKAIFDLFMTEPVFSQAAKDAAEFNEKIRQQMAAIDAATPSILTYSKSIGYLAGEWEKAIKLVFSPPVSSAGTWVDTFVSTLKSIETAWANTMQSFMTEGGNWKDFMEDMFMGVLESFNRMITEIAARNLMHKIFGGDVVPTAGIPSLFDFRGGGKIGGQSDYTPGLSMPEIPTIGSPKGLQKMAPVTINMQNNGEPRSLRVTSRQFDGKQYIINAVLEEYNSNPNFRNRLQE